MVRRTKAHPIRTIRYTLLLTEDEAELAKQVAKREFRKLPDFFRMHIYSRAAALGLMPSSSEPQKGKLLDRDSHLIATA